MPKVYIDRDELYPYYCLTTERYAFLGQAELTDAEVADLERVNREWDAWQMRLGAAFAGHTAS